jgi:hypothetical protein
MTCVVDVMCDAMEHARTAKDSGLNELTTQTNRQYFFTDLLCSAPIHKMG